MDIYHYSFEGVFVGVGVAELDPVARKRGEEKHIFPANCTTKKPPMVGKNEEAIFVDGAWTVEAIPAPEPEPEIIDERTAEEKAKDQRKALLSDTDWYVIRQAEGGEAIPENVKAYRVALRDITNQSGFPDVIEWPTL